MAEIRLKPATLDESGFAPSETFEGYLIGPDPLMETEARQRLRRLEEQTGKPFDPIELGPGASDVELWPTDTGDPETGLPTFRLV